jgi:trimeric autotransporter adhesin
VGCSEDIRHDTTPRATRGRGAASACVGTVTVAAIAAAFVVAVPSIARSQAVDSRLPTVEPGGRVLAIARAGDAFYLGGNFLTMGPPTGSGIPVDPTAGSPMKDAVIVTGEVHTVLADGAGGWYVGGNFVAVNGEARSNLAHLREDRTVDTSFPQTDGTVRALALAHDRLYVGGEFTAVSGAPRGRLAAIEVATGALESWAPDADAWVLALAVDGSTVFAGGTFNRIGGADRRGLAALSAKSGLATPWAAHVDSFRTVYALAIHQEALCAGGNFRTIAGQPRRGLAVLDARTAAVLEPRFDVERIPDWNHYDSGPTVEALAAHDKRLYLGGTFTHVGGIARNGAAAVELDGTITEWDAHLETTPGTPAARCMAIAVRDGAVYLGGDFAGIAGKGRAYAGAVDVRTGALRSWDPRPNGRVLAISTAPGATFMGGLFTSAWSWEERRGLAAINATTGALLPWNPDANELVSSLIVADGSIYVAGTFSRVGGADRAGLAELDLLTGVATPWNPQPSGSVRTLAVAGATVVAGGWYSRIGGQPRRNLAAIDRGTGLATSWDPSPNDIVEALVVRGGTVYAGGWFWRIGNVPREELAAFDLDTGALLDWNPGAYGVVLALAADEDVVYVGGYFTRLGGAERFCLGAVDRATAQATDWSASLSDPSFSVRVQTLALRGPTLYAGGIFTEIGGAQRTRLAALDTRTGSALDWGLTPESTVWCISAHPDAIYVGGGFHHIGMAPAAGLASLAPLGVTIQKPQLAPRLEARGATIAAVAAQSPAHTSARLRFRMLASGPVSLTIYDVQGRRVARVLDAAPHAAGDHEVVVPTGRWPEGCYLFRLESGAEAETGRLVVVH